MNNKLRNSLIVVLLALTGVMQATAVEYKNSYQQSAISNQRSTVNYQLSTATPTVGFQSTSAMPVSVGVGTSTLNEDGTVNAEAYGVGRANIGPRKDPVNPNPGTPDDEGDDPGEQQPLGDGVWILTALACAYLLGRVILNNKRALKG